MSKPSKQLATAQKRAETGVILIVVDGVLYKVRDYAATASYRRST